MGGWSEERLADPRIHINSSRCDITEIWVGAPRFDEASDSMVYDYPMPSPAEFYMKYLIDGRPVVFRNALGHNINSSSDQHDNRKSSFFAENIKKVLKKDNFLAEYGQYVFPVSDIPYARTFGQASSQATLQEVR
jgi:hypothetical protein